MDNPKKNAGKVCDSRDHKGHWRTSSGLRIYDPRGEIASLSPAARRRLADLHLTPVVADRQTDAEEQTAKAAARSLSGE